VCVQGGDSVGSVGFVTVTAAGLWGLVVGAGTFPLYGEDHRRGDLHW
jgi:hypothetical protein